MKRLVLIFVLFAAAASAQGAKSESSAEVSVGWQWANFAILAVGLGYLMWKMLPPFFRARTEQIQHGILEAQKQKQEAERRAAEMEARLAALGDDIEKFRAQAHFEMEQEAARIAEDTRRQHEHALRQTDLEIETATKVARRELRAFAAQLALELAEARIRARLTPAVERALFEDFAGGLARVEREASRN